MTAGTARVDIADAAGRPRGRLRVFWDSTPGKKMVMAVTGILGIGFVIVHMAGNLLMFRPDGAQEAMRGYASGLRTWGPLLWIARFGLLGITVLHVAAALQLARRARTARPQRYERREPRVSTIASRTMRAGGVLLVAFLVFHIADMTLGVGHPAFVHLDPYNNLVVGFRRWWAVAFYLLAILALGAHLYHGAWASWRTLGFRRAGDRPLSRSFAVVLAVLVSAGFAAVPIAAALGIFDAGEPATPVISQPARPS